MTSRLASLFVLALLALCCSRIADAAQPQQASAPAPLHQHASVPQAPVLASPLPIPLDAATLASLPRESVTATAHGKTLHCEGITLVSLLRAADALPASALKGEALARYVLVTARDGYRAVYALAELEPTLGNHRVLLVDRCEDQPLDAEDGPLRLIAPAESRPARWVRQVQSITVVSSP